MANRVSLNSSAMLSRFASALLIFSAKTSGPFPVPFTTSPTVPMPTSPSLPILVRPSKVTRSMPSSASCFILDFASLRSGFG